MTALAQAPEHKPVGDPCSKCGTSAKRHRMRRGRKQSDRTKERRRIIAREKTRAAREKRNSAPIVGIDGEGRGRAPHVYTYMAAVQEDGTKLGQTECQEGLPTAFCLNFLLKLAEEHGVRRVFGYSLGYDFSMMLRDLPDVRLYELVRPELRARQLETGRNVHRPVYWNNYKITFMRRRLSVRRCRWDHETKRSVGYGPTIVVWDVFAFYQGKFTKALGDWKTAPAEILKEITRMKDKRSAFDRMSPQEIQKYCDTECELLARLVRQLIDAHDAADLPLESFYGAGSTASVLLTRMGVKDKCADPPVDMHDAIARAFYGGRFELSRCGPVREPCWNHDISSAYPYELWKLPCLTCGRWRLVTGSPRDVDKAIRSSRLALVHCIVKRSGPRGTEGTDWGPKCWGPFPFRIGKKIGDADTELLAGTIIFPLKSHGSWVWRDEYLAAKDTLWPGVEAVDAWCYDTSCDCRPFGELPEIYRRRCQIGKDGPGIVMKLGPNSCYGKLAQSVGSAPFRSWIWAGCVTSGTRAQILRAIACARDPENILMIATDGILAREKLNLPQPLDTGTAEIQGPVDNPKGGKPCDECGRTFADKGQHTCTIRKPLGGWEIGEKPKGIFLARPGIYWPLEATVEELKSIRARGLSRSVLTDQAKWIEKHFAKHGWQEPYRVDGRCLECGWRASTGLETDAELQARPPWQEECPSCKANVPPPCIRFVGVRQGIRKGKQTDRCEHGKEDGDRNYCEHCVVRSDDFAEWVEWPIDVSFGAFPKRVTVRKDLTLETWDSFPGISAPYSKATPGFEALRIAAHQEMIEESPDGDLVEG